MDEVVSPYDLLGLTPNKCSIQDVRKAYRELALICHPDKGGNAGDMRILQAAYQWIMKQMVSITENASETYEEKEKSFKDFLESQTPTGTNVVPFVKVIEEVTGFTEELFEAAYEKHKTTDDPLTKDFIKQQIGIFIMWEFGHRHIETSDDEPIEQVVDRKVAQYLEEASKKNWSYASIPDGYGSYMAPVETNDHSFGKTEMIIYKEPTQMPITKQVRAQDVEQQTQLEDYTQDSMCDYRVAYKDTHKPLQPLEENYPAPPYTSPQTDVQDALAALQVQRRLEGMNMDVNDNVRSALERLNSQSRKLSN